MRRPSQQIDDTFRVKFDSLHSNAIKIQLNKTKSVINTGSNIDNSKPEDIYYDEIIYYDGGGVDGWLSNEDT